MARTIKINLKRAFSVSSFLPGISILGVCALAAAFAIYPKDKTAQAVDCSFGGVTHNAAVFNTTTPAVNTYKTTWEVKNWIAAGPNADRAMVIGPNSWQVSTAINAGGTVSCISETWTVGQYAYADRDAGGKGSLIKPGGVITGGCGCRDSLFVKPVNYSGGYDQAFRNGFSEAPVGLYGVLKTSKDDLNESRSYYPNSWVVTGNL